MHRNTKLALINAIIANFVWLWKCRFATKVSITTNNHSCAKWDEKSFFWFQYASNYSIFWKSLIIQCLTISVQLTKRNF